MGELQLGVRILVAAIAIGLVLTGSLSGIFSLIGKASADIGHSSFVDKLSEKTETLCGDEYLTRMPSTEGQYYQHSFEKLKKVKLEDDELVLTYSSGQLFVPLSENCPDYILNKDLGDKRGTFNFSFTEAEKTTVEVKEAGG